MHTDLLGKISAAPSYKYRWGGEEALEVNSKTSIMEPAAFNSANTSGGERKEGGLALFSSDLFGRATPLIKLNYYAAAVLFFTLGGSLYLSL